jgi:hypothetical protein
MPEIVRIGGVGAQDRGALQGRRLRGADHRRLSPGGGRGVGRAAAEHHPPRNCSWSRSIRAGWARTLSPARTIRRWSRALAPPPRRADGPVARVTPTSVWIAPEPAPRAAPLKPGDGVVFDAADWRSPEEKEEGGRVYHVTPQRGGQAGSAPLATARSTSAASAPATCSGARTTPSWTRWRAPTPKPRAGAQAAAATCR